MHAFKYCPNCKSDNFKFPDQRRFECHDCGMIFYQNIAAAVGIIIEHKEKLLFTIRNKNPKKGYLDLPGGFTDPNETAEETCARELKEELNIKIAPQHFKYFTSRPNIYEFKDFSYKTEDLIFTAEFPVETTVELEAEEIQAIKWIDRSEIDITKIAFKSLQSAVKAYLKER